MTRRPALPGAAELFRRTDSSPAPLADAGPAAQAEPRPLRLIPAQQVTAAPAPPTGVWPTIPTRARSRGVRATGRTKHDEKITVYLSADELTALEAARLTLRARHGLGTDRGRIVRAALAVVLADLETSSENSILVQHLRTTTPDRVTPSLT